MTIMVQVDKIENEAILKDTVAYLEKKGLRTLRLTWRAMKLLNPTTKKGPIFPSPQILWQKGLELSTILK